MIGAFFKSWVSTQPDLRREVGNRVFAQAANPKAPYPFLVYNTISDSGLRSLRGPSGLRYETLQIDVVGNNYPQLQAIATMLVGGKADRRLDGYSVSVGDAERDGFVVREVRWLNSIDGYSDPIHGEAQGPRTISIDFKFTYEWLAGAGTIATALGHLGDGSLLAPASPPDQGG